LLRAAEWLGFPVTQIEETLKVVSPLAMPARVAKERRFIYAGTADQLAPPEHAWRLWNHWDRPQVLWYQGGHVSFLMEPTVRNLLSEALSARAMLDSVRDAERESERERAAVLLRRSTEAPRDFSLALAAQG
jgi:hypothetical protein